MEIKPTKTEKDYELALERLDIIFHTKPGTKESDELEILAPLIEDNEEKKYPINSPDPIEALEFRMEQMNMTQTDLTDIIGHKSPASEIPTKREN